MLTSGIFSVQGALESSTISSELLGFQIQSIIGILEVRKHNVSEPGSVPILRSGGETLSLLGPLERANLNLWTTPSQSQSQSQSYFITGSLPPITLSWQAP
jgi:hypothetical protein